MAEVYDELCVERRKNITDRLDRDKERIESLEKQSGDLEKLSVQMGELLKKYDEQITDTKDQLKEHDARIAVVEAQPAKKWNQMVGAGLAAIGTAGGGAALTLIAQHLGR